MELLEVNMVDAGQRREVKMKLERSERKKKKEKIQRRGAKNIQRMTSMSTRKRGTGVIGVSAYERSG